VLAGCLLAMFWAYHLTLDQIQPAQLPLDDESSGLQSDIRRDSLHVIAKRVQDGLSAFSQQQQGTCLRLALAVGLALILYCSVYTVIAYFWGVVVALGCSVISLYISAQANERIAAASSKNLDICYKMALKAATVLGCLTVSIQLLCLLVLIFLFYLLQGCYLKHYAADQK
jgi:Na+/H+-translocating membrane pyrophosphatase